MENISVQSEDDAGPNREPCFDIPVGQNPHFVNRPDLMRWIKEQYAGLNTRIALVGMGGFGKSQVAIKFAHQIHLESPGTSVFWVHASSALKF
ncbi:hypothetical protein QQX98_011318 [Neonectria punicea]|uniref:NB-ARC domain-containing protein n=1 Tax=Neonectria punicea TaxID=979145 RepID=A0ABR1GMF7_9HYPO